MVGLLDRGFSERGVLDLVLAFKAPTLQLPLPLPVPLPYPYP